MAFLKIKVIPGASRNEIAGKWQEMIKLKVTAHPEDGKANEACIELLSEKLGISKNMIVVTKGHKSREKIIEIKNIKEIELLDKILRVKPPPVKNNWEI